MKDGGKGRYGWRYVSVEETAPRMEKKSSTSIFFFFIILWYKNIDGNIMGRMPLAYLSNGIYKLKIHPLMYLPMYTYIRSDCVCMCVCERERGEAEKPIYNLLISKELQFSNNFHILMQYPPAFLPTFM